MQNNFCVELILTSLLALTAGPGWAGQRDLAVAEVHVYRELLPDKVRYTYVVTNKGTSPITALEVGYDYYLGEPELRGMRPSRVSAHPGWSHRVTGLEESDLYSVGWETSSVAIQPGQTRSGFVVETSGQDPQFLGAHWSIVADGPIVSASDRVVQIAAHPPADTLPPLIRVTPALARLWPPNGKLEAVQFRVDVSDETDPNPTVKLQSIECGDCRPGDIDDATIGADDRQVLLRAERRGSSKPGRVYLVTYEARDAAGNVAVASTEVIVPHDLGE